ncbi:hypothetical protein [Thermogemmatispora tikiterensis]|uniref:Uncharacterized protein n=1 Tax=Thermogemmatispora tikiterensis TaxID=1825093 RepID=A0A328VF74_9CHLR|nr:hypothetical protein [Thermogemmatispora tikiterensis]RAQ93964.1 hypothetical protein A4R35_00370 [Thermogemmatispora tikiterensis]
MANERRPISREQLAREKALYIYLRAFERGDFDTMDRILQEAMGDSELEQMIIDVHRYYLEEEQFFLQEEELEKLRQIVWQYLPSAVRDEGEEVQIPPLTCRDVLIRMQENVLSRGAIKQELQRLLQQLPGSTPALPDDLSLQNIRRLFERLGLQPTLPFLKHFREQAIMLAMQRRQGQAGLAAARQQRAAWQRRQEEQRTHRKPEA